MRDGLVGAVVAHEVLGRLPAHHEVRFERRAAYGVGYVVVPPQSVLGGGGVHFVFVCHDVAQPVSGHMVKAYHLGLQTITVAHAERQFVGGNSHVGAGRDCGVQGGRAW